MDSALKLVGDRHNLTARQRMAVRRSACSDAALARRAATMTTLAQITGQPLAIDGYNLLITVESALSGGLVLIGRDGCYRDLASIHGTYRKVEETQPALELIVDYLAAWDIPRIDCFLDRPVANSGRLKALITGVVAGRTGRGKPRTEHSESLDQIRPAPPGTRKATQGIAQGGSLHFSPPSPEARTKWNVELVDSPDRVLRSFPAPIVSSDSAVLDECGAWINLAAEIIDTCVRNAWKIDLRSTSEAV